MNKTKQCIEMLEKNEDTKCSTWWPNQCGVEVEERPHASFNQMQRGDQDPLRPFRKGLFQTELSARSAILALSPQRYP